ncbi:YbhB/YbcL family Raf kinase inhibitor-like protein [Microbulbifer flavimaris]|uniref:YbhB/YbcL family Raf kinase inhibitor-like protein n=1 Tax=Microbulbifer flavimaris TaxID=1781068 RepID=A0ABX4HWM5_9GAMM|nr:MULTISPECIES: YbhB/YbcL family Raf kinase inhibitor-like protein [Microbulbifer]PCO04471.1 YbhB/YbcL family Raf kinase inhibitor-like protein [Microbulbifer flavimaris]
MNPIGRPRRARTLVTGWAAKLVAAITLTVTASMSAAQEFTLKSDTLKPGERMPMEHVYSGCGGENVSPALSWSGAPEGTKSFALMVYDPDAPTGSGWWHWVLFNIPADRDSLPAGAGEPKNGLIPEAIQARNDYGAPGYGGACPPKGHGDHRYQFRLVALDVEELPLDDTATPAKVGFNVNAHKLAEAELEVLWGH